MIKNKKGYTLIELIIAIAIMAVASTMIMVGVFNIVSLFTESSVINTNTNTVFNSVIEKIGDNPSSYDETLVLNNGSTTLSISNSTVSDQINEMNLVRLSYFIPEYKASMLPAEEPEPPKPVEGLPADFFLLTDFNKIPTNPRTNPTYAAFLYQVVAGVENSVKKDTATGVYVNNFSSFILKYPSSELVDTFYRNIIKKPYTDVLNGSYDIRYFYLDYRYANSRPSIYGYYIPKKKGIYLSYNYGNKAKWVEIKNNKIDENDLKDENGVYFNTFEIYDRSQSPQVHTYSRSEILNMKFYETRDASETFYEFSVY